MDAALAAVEHNSLERSLMVYDGTLTRYQTLEAENGVEQVQQNVDLFRKLMADRLID